MEKITKAFIQWITTGALAIIVLSCGTAGKSFKHENVSALDLDYH